MKQQFLVDVTGTIRLTVYDKNRPQVPSSATIVLYLPSGGVLQSSASATVNSTTGEMTYSLTTSHTDIADLNYKAVWTYVVNSVTYYQTQLFDVVKSILAISIIDDDLYNELESLRETNNQATGTATSATSSTLLDTARRKEVDDYWKGGIIETLSGTGANQRRAVTGFAQSTATVSVTPNWVTTPDSTTTYRIVRSYHYKIEESFKEIETMLYNKGKRHELILESSQIEIPLKYLSLHKICTDLMNEEGDKWEMLSKLYMEKFEKAFNSLTLEYDEDDSGNIAGEEEASRPNTLRIGRA